MTYLGIDPGANGGIAWTGPDGAAAEKMPELEADVFRLLSGLARDSVACIERVAAHPKHGSIAGFKLGRSYGFLRGCLTALGIPFIEVAPGKWQRALECLSGGDKAVTRARAQQLFPGLRCTHAISDALLLAVYCSRQDWRGVTTRKEG